METIEERAMILAEEESICHDIQKRVYRNCVAIAKEERERCINAAQEWYCIRCCDTSGEECHYCHIKEHIRKAMEGGNK